MNDIKLDSFLTQSTFILAGNASASMPSLLTRRTSELGFSRAAAVGAVAAFYKPGLLAERVCVVSRWASCRWRAATSTAAAPTAWGQETRTADGVSSSTSKTALRSPAAPSAAPLCVPLTSNTKMSSFRVSHVTRNVNHQEIISFYQRTATYSSCFYPRQSKRNTVKPMVLLAFWSRLLSRKRTAEMPSVRKTRGECGCVFVFVWFLWGIINVSINASHTNTLIRRFDLQHPGRWRKFLHFTAPSK